MFCTEQLTESENATESRKRSHTASRASSDLSHHTRKRLKWKRKTERKERKREMDFQELLHHVRLSLSIHVSFALELLDSLEKPIQMFPPPKGETMRTFRSEYRHQLMLFKRIFLQFSCEYQFFTMDLKNETHAHNLKRNFSEEWLRQMILLLRRVLIYVPSDLLLKELEVSLENFPYLTYPLSFWEKQLNFAHQKNKITPHSVSDSSSPQ